MPAHITQPDGLLSPNFEVPSLMSFPPDGEPMFNIHKTVNDYALGERLICGSQRFRECSAQPVHHVYHQHCTSAADSNHKGGQEQRTDEERIACIIRRTAEYYIQMDVVHTRMPPTHLKASSLTLEERVTQLMERTAAYKSQEAAMQITRQYRHLSSAKSSSSARSVKHKAAFINSTCETPLVLNNQPGQSYVAVSGSASLSIPIRQSSKNQVIHRVPAYVYAPALPSNSGVGFPAKRSPSRLHRVPATRVLRLQAFYQRDKPLPKLPQKVEVTDLMSANATTSSSHQQLEVPDLLSANATTSSSHQQSEILDLCSSQPPNTTAGVCSTPSTANFDRQNPRDIHVLIDQLEKIVTSSGAKLSNYIRPIVLRHEPKIIQQLRDSRLYLEIEPSSPMLQKRQSLGSTGVANRNSLSMCSRSTISKRSSVSISADAASKETLRAMIPRHGDGFLDLFRAVLTAQYVVERLQEKDSNARDRESSALGLDRLSSSQDSLEVSQHPVSLFKSATGLIVGRGLKRCGKSTVSSSATQRHETIRNGLSEMCREVMHHIWGPGNKGVLQSLHATAMDIVKRGDGFATGQ